jgi:hypothetical protein
MNSNTKNPLRKEDDPRAMNQIKNCETADACSVALLAWTKATPMA